MRSRRCRRHGSRGGGGAGGSGGGARGNTPTPGPQQGAPWPTFHHPWSGRISMWSFQGPGPEARPPAALVRWCAAGVHLAAGVRLRLSVALDLDACRFVVAHAAGYSTVRAGWLGRGRPGCLPDSHSDSADGSRVDRGHRCYLPHHSRPWYTHLCSPSFLSPFVHHGGEWLVSSCHICGCRRPSRLFSHSRCSCRSFFGPQSSFYSSVYC